MYQVRSVAGPPSPRRRGIRNPTAFILGCSLSLAAFVCNVGRAPNFLAPTPASRSPAASAARATRTSLRAEGPAWPCGPVEAIMPPKRSPLVLAWGALGVAAYLSYGAKKVVPIVLVGLSAIESSWQWAMLFAFLAFFAYFEGYKTFGKTFSPRVVARAWVVSQRATSLTDSVAGAERAVAKPLPLWHKVLAPAFCMGYFHATRARIIASWLLPVVVAALIFGVKRLPNPYRAMITAGAVVGLSVGSLFTLAIFARSLVEGKPPHFDPALPVDTPYTPL